MTGHGHPEPYHHTLPPHLRKPVTTAHTTASIAALNNTSPLTPLPATKSFKTTNTVKVQRSTTPAPAKKGKGRMGNFPKKRATLGFVRQVKNTVTNTATGSEKAAGWESGDEDCYETEATHHRTDSLLTAQSDSHRTRVTLPKTPAQKGLSTIPETTTIDGALGTSTSLSKPHKVFEGEERERYTKPELPEMVVEYPGPFSGQGLVSEMPVRYKLGETVLDHVDLEEVKRKQTEFTHAVIHNVKAYLRTGDGRLLGSGDEQRVDREGREEDDQDDQGAWGGMSEEFKDLRAARRQRSDRELVRKN